MSQTAELVVKLRQVGGEQLTQLAGKLNNVGKQAAAASTDFKELAADLKKWQAESIRSINNLKGYANAWREVANSVEIGSQEFKEATAEAAKLEAQLRKVQPGGPAGRLGKFAQIAGTVAGAGVFGGVAGGAGSLLGGLFGGVPGAIVGGAIGAQVGNIGAGLGAKATYAAELEKQRTALAGLTKNYGEYTNALRQVESLSQQFAIPQEVITRQFTKLAASVLGAGGNLQDTEKAFKGVAAGIRGTGGDLQDLDSALTATAQVFSKGKVSAEELRQQIGERLPGAFTLFAQSLDMTPAELDKALEKGQVSLQNFQKFSELLFQRFGKSAEAIVNSPASAGDRLQVQLSKLNENVGKLLAPIGAAFQNTFAAIVKAINEAVSALVRFFNLNIADRVEEYQQKVIALEKSVKNAEPQAKGRLRTQLATARLNLKIAQEQRNLRMAGAGADKEPPSGLPGIQPDSGTAKSLANKAQQTYDRILSQLKADLDSATKLKLTKDLYNLEKDIQAALQEGNTSLAEALQSKRKMIQLDALENALINERERLEALIVDGRSKGLDVTKVENQLQRVNTAFAELQTDQLREQNAQSLEGLKIAQEFNKQFTYEGATPEEFPSVFKILNDQIKMLQQTMQDVAPRMSALADGLSGALSNAFEGLVFSAQTANQTLASVFQGIAKSFQDMVIQMIKDYLKMQIMKFFANLFAPSLPSFAGSNFGTASSTFTNPSFGIDATGLGGGLTGGAANLASTGFYSGVSFAMGGIMTGKGPLALKRYAMGGIASSPQLAMFGEGSRPEAYVPLPDGRSIPVTMKGGAGGDVNVTVNVDASGTNVQGNEPDARQLGRAVSAAVQAELVKQQRPGGLLSGTR